MAAIIHRLTMDAHDHANAQLPDEAALIEHGADLKALLSYTKQLEIKHGERRDAGPLELICELLNSLDEDSTEFDDWVELPDLLDEDGRSALLSLVNVMVHRAG